MNDVDWIRHAAIFAAFVGQTGFIVTYATRPWWIYWVTRSLMLKSVGLELLIGLTAVHYALRYTSDDPPWLRPSDPVDARLIAEASLCWVIVIGIFAQWISLIAEIRHDWLKRGVDLDQFGYPQCDEDEMQEETR